MRIETVVHSSKVKCKQFQNILRRFARDFDVFPSFDIIIGNIDNAIYSKWGMIYLTNVPTEEDYSYADKYLTILGLGFHGIVPSTELNRILIWIASRNIFGLDINPKVHNFMVSLFSLFSTIYVLMKKDSWRRIVGEIVEKYCENIRLRTKLDKLIYDYMHSFMGDSENEDIAKIKSLIGTNMPIYLKSKLFFELVRKYEHTFEPWSYQERYIRRFVIPIKCSEEPLKHAKQFEKTKLSPEEMEHIAEYDRNLAKKIAKKLDGEYRGGDLPAYSDSPEMIQQLLEKRRYLAAVRRARIRRVMSLIETMLLMAPESRKRYGYDSWYIGDDEEDLDIEISAENFGKVIPDLSTLKNIYEKRGELGGEGGIGHIELCIDTSGSMNGDNIEIAVEIGIALVEIAKKYEKTIGLTTFSSGVWHGLEPTQDYDLVEEIILRLDACGGTNIRNVFNTIERHLSLVSEKPLVGVITDTMIYDINYPIVRQRFGELKNRSKIVIFAITDKIWKKSEDTIINVGLETIRMSPRELDEESIEYIIDVTRRVLGQPM